jgi:hypothetical protein
MKYEPLVWVKDNAGNRFLCPLDALMDPDSVPEDEKKTAIDDASEHKKLESGNKKLKFSEPLP